MSNTKELRFGRLLVISDKMYLPVGNQGRKAVFYECRCDCGITKTIRYDDLRSNRTVSCGCYNKENTKTKFTAHGMRNHPLYNIWNSMIQRCYNPNSKSYKNYGGRGIIMCDEWKNELTGCEQFATDMGNRPSHKHSIDRIDVNGNYQPNNCRWATPDQQMRNTRRNKLLSYNGITKPLVEWAEEYNLPYDILAGRIRKKWSMETALTFPHVSRMRLEAHAEIHDVKNTYKGWADLYNINISTLRKRLRSGMSVEEALAKPVKKQ